MMTIEEKAKAYDEALGRAKASYGTGAYDDATTEFIFPELTETDSKDERIRKALIRFFSRYSTDVMFNDEFSPANIIEYLEKRSETPKKWLKEDYDYYDTIVRKLEVIGEDSGLTRNQIQFLSEHNPCDFEVEIEKAYKNADEVQYRKGFKDGVASVKSPEWTEEDEEKVELIDAMCDDGLKDCLPCSTMYREYNEIKNWVKNLSNRIISNTWTEEDETMVEAIIEAIPTNYAASDYKEMVSWLRLKLKYLRPAPQIKSVDYENI